METIDFQNPIPECAEESLALAAVLSSVVAQYTYIEGVEAGHRRQNVRRCSPVSPQFRFLMVNGLVVFRAIARTPHWEFNWNSADNDLMISPLSEKEALILDYMTRRLYGNKSIENGFTNCHTCGKPAICNVHSGAWVCESCYALSQSSESANASFVYVIGHPDIGYKIGVSKNPQTRLSHIDRAAKFPYPLAIVHLISVHPEQAFGLESRLHRDFGQFRMRGEWFRLTDEHLNQIRNYSTP